MNKKTLVIKRKINAARVILAVNKHNLSLFRAKGLYFSAINDAKILKSAHMEHFVMCRLGELYAESGNLFRASNLYRKAVAWYDGNHALVPRQEYVSVLTDYAKLCVEQNEHGIAEKHYLKALDFCHPANVFADTVASIRRSLGLLYMELEQNDRALYYFNSSLKYFRSKSDIHSVASLYSHIGRICRREDDHVQAAKMLGLAIDAYMKLEKSARYDEEVATAFLDLGMAYLTAKDYYEAIEAILSSVERLKILSQCNAEKYKMTLDSAQRCLVAAYMCIAEYRLHGGHQNKNGFYTLPAGYDTAKTLYTIRRQYRKACNSLLEAIYFNSSAM